MKKLDWKKLVINTVCSLVIPVVIFLVFAILTKGRTATVRVFTTTIRQSIVPIMICFGLMLNMSVGMINFSAGAMITFAGIIGGNLANMTGTGVPGVFGFCLLITVALGAITGVLYNLIRVPSMVLTIGTLMIWEAAPYTLFTEGANMRSNMTILAREPYCYILLAILFVAFYILTNKTAFGHNLSAIGNNQAIANSVGLDSDKIKFFSFLFGSMFLGVAATVHLSITGALRNVTAMSSMTVMMDGFMGVFMAMFLSRYCNTSIAVVIGTFSMRMLSNGFLAMGFSSTARDVVQGVLLLALLTISANAGIIETSRANKAFKDVANKEYLGAAAAK